MLLQGAPWMLLHSAGLLIAVAGLTSAIAERRGINLKSIRIMREHLAQFTCFVNGLQPWYDALEENRLPIDTVHELIALCNKTASATRHPSLTADKVFLSHFFIRSCRNYDAYPHNKRHGRQRNITGEADIDDALRSSGLRNPLSVQLDSEFLGKRLPQWLWDGDQYDFTKIRNTVHDITHGQGVDLVGLGRLPVFSQGQHGHLFEPKWRRLDLREWQHKLIDASQYHPGGLWVNAELWSQPKGRNTGYHYDYDSHVTLLQVKGSRRFHVLTPRSDALNWEALEEPWTKPIDYGTRWGKPKDASKIRMKERTFEMMPGSVLRVPNGWPHTVLYHEDSIGFRVSTWTQCQALSMWLGQRLCLLTTVLNKTRLCFDDEDYREHGGFATFEHSSTAS